MTELRGKERATNELEALPRHMSIGTGSIIPRPKGRAIARPVSPETRCAGPPPKRIDRQPWANCWLGADQDTIAFGSWLRDRFRLLLDMAIRKAAQAIIISIHHQRPGPFLATVTAMVLVWPIQPCSRVRARLSLGQVR